MSGAGFLLLGGESTSVRRAEAPRIVREGQFFKLASGEPWTVIECSDFSLFQRELDGEDIRPILQQRADLGFNTLRVWILNQTVVGFRNATADTGIHPNQRPDFYQRLTAFVQTCGRYGLAVEVTAFTSTQTLMPDPHAQREHWARTVEALRDQPNVLLELVNEADQHDNALTVDVPEPFGLIASRGSNGADSPPPLPPWGYSLFHTNDLDEFQRKVGHNAMEWADVTGHPCISNENTRYPDRDSSPEHAYDAAMGAALLCAGSCYHSQAGKYSRLFDGVELECARAWVAGARSVPLEFRAGRYMHHADMEGPDAIRVYERRLPSGKGLVIRIRP